MKNVLFVALVVFGLAACSPSYYPPKINAPLLREEGEVKLNAALNINSINLQGSTAITDKFAIAGSINGFRVGSSEITTSGRTTRDGGSSGFQVDIMSGYYVPFGNSGVIEIYAGYGAGVTNSDEVNGLLHRLMIQPSIGVAGKRGEFAFSCRISRVMIPSSSISSDDPNESFYDTFLEPGLSFRLGSEELKFTTQVGVSLPIVNIPDDPDGNYIEWNPLILNLGLQYNFLGW